MSIHTKHSAADCEVCAAQQEADAVGAIPTAGHNPDPQPQQQEEPERIDFSCRVCGIQCAIAPDPPERAVCPEHCEDHNYVYSREDRGTFCEYCWQEAPHD